MSQPSIRKISCIYFRFICSAIHLPHISLYVHGMLSENQYDRSWPLFLYLYHFILRFSTTFPAAYSRFTLSLCSLSSSTRCFIATSCLSFSNSSPLLERLRAGFFAYGWQKPNISEPFWSLLTSNHRIPSWIYQLVCGVQLLSWSKPTSNSHSRRKHFSHSRGAKSQALRKPLSDLDLVQPFSSRPCLPSGHFYYHIITTTLRTPFVCI